MLTGPLSATRNASALVILLVVPLWLVIGYRLARIQRESESETYPEGDIDEESSPALAAAYWLDGPDRWPVSGDRARSLVAAQAGGCPHRDAARALDAIKLDGAQMAA